MYNNITNISILQFNNSNLQNIFIDRVVFYSVIGINIVSSDQ